MKQNKNEKRFIFGKDFVETDVVSTSVFSKKIEDEINKHPQNCFLKNKFIFQNENIKNYKYQKPFQIIDGNIVATIVM